MSDGNSILLSVVSTLTGFALGTATSWYFYRESGKELDEKLRLPKLILNAIAYIHEHPTNTTFTRDADGNITGVTVSATGLAHGSSTATGVGSFTITPPPQYDRQGEQPKAEIKDAPDA